MRLRGSPPEGLVGVSYIGTPTGSVVGYISGPQGIQGVPGDPALEFHYVGDSGADPTGATGDLGAIITSLATSLHTAGGGTIYVPPGTYRFTTTGTINSSRVNLICAGSGAVTFVPTAALGASPCLDISARTGWSVDHGGTFTGFTIDGTAIPTGVGLLFGDMVRGQLDDIVIDNYPQGDALRFCNRVTWTERTVLSRVTLGDNNRRGWSFKIDGGTPSFGYTRAEVAINLNPVAATVTVDSVTTTAGSTSATVASGGFPSVTTGMAVDGTNLHGGTNVAGVSGNTLTLATPALASGTATLKFAPNNQTGIYLDTGCYFYNTVLTLVVNAAGGTPGTDISPVLMKLNTGFYDGSHHAGMEGMVFTITGESDAKKVTPVWVAANTIFDGFGNSPLAFTNPVSYRASTAIVRVAGRIDLGFAPNENPAMNYAITDNSLHMFRGRRHDETHDRLVLWHDGSVNFGSGSASPDVKLYRHPAGWLATPDTFLIENSLISITPDVASDAFISWVAGDPVGNRFKILAAGKHEWSDGTNPVDTNLYRNAANELKTDDALTVAGLLKTAASATGNAGLRLPHGAAPTSPADGDVWTTSAGLFARINGVTKAAGFTKVYVDAQPGADDDARFTAALAELGTDPGVLVLGSKRYTLTSTKTINRGYQGIIGPGAKCSFLSFTGTGACLRMYDSTAATGDEPDPAGPLHGFTIEGWANANNNTYGLLYGNLMNPDVDIHIEGFQNSGGVGFFGQNSNSNWCEGGNFRMRTRFCKTHYIFDEASWAYNDFDLWVRAEPNEDAINVGPITPAGLNGTRLYLHGNFISGAGSNSGTAITVGPGSHIHGDIQVSVESNGSLIGHADIDIGAAGEIRGLGSGILDFQAYTAAWQKGTAKPTQISGIAFANCPSLPSPGPAVNTPPILFDSFTAADGTALDVAKWTVTDGGAAAADVTTNGNRARFTAGATGGYSGADKAYAVSTAPTSLADVEILLRHTFGAVANESNMRYGVRATNADPNAGSNYHVIVTNDSFYVEKRVSGTPTGLFSSNFSGLSLTAAANGGMKWVRLRAKDTTIAAKIWDEGTAEPLGWTFTTTDSSVTAGGSVAVAIHGGNAAVSGVNYVDQFHVYAL